MSLIADALKRAKAAQQTAPRQDSAAVPYQQVDPKAARPARKGIFLPAGLLVLTLIALIAVWLGFRQGNATAPSAAATPRSAAGAARPSPTLAQVPPQVPKPDRTVTEPPGKSESNGLLSPALSSKGGEGENPAPVVAPAVPVPTPSAGPPPELPSKSETTGISSTTLSSLSSRGREGGDSAAQNPPPLRLQAIFFSPSHPWAMIGGKTIYVGDQVGDFKVVAIAAESATLVSAGQTNILTVSR